MFYKYGKYGISNEGGRYLQNVRLKVPGTFPPNNLWATILHILQTENIKYQKKILYYSSIYLEIFTYLKLFARVVNQSSECNSALQLHSIVWGHFGRQFRVKI